MENKIQIFKSYLKSFDFLTNQEIENLVSLAIFKKIDRNEFFVKRGQVCQKVAFVLSGTLRSFYVSDKGEEMTYCITFPNSFTTAYSSYLTGNPSIENIQVITEVEAFVFPKEKLEVLANQSKSWLFFQKIMAENQYIELEKRIFQLQTNDANIRYKDLTINHPEYIKNIPLQYLASYLGITNRHLSRIRKELTY